MNNDIIIKRAKTLFDSFNKNEKFAAKLGMFPASKMASLKTLGFTHDQQHQVTVELMRLGKG